MKTLLILLLLVTPVLASDLSPADIIFEMASDAYPSIPENDCLIQQMCVDEDDGVKWYEVYIFRDGSIAMMPWEGE